MAKQYPIIKSWVKYLEMKENPKIDDTDFNLKGTSLQLQDNLSVDNYLNLYKKVGRHYIWNYRPSQSKEKVQEIISNTTTRIYFFIKNDDTIGFSEVGCSDAQNIEIVHFGLLQSQINKGLGKELFKALLKDLWALSPDRIYLSTCGLDHEKAVTFYQNAGFSIFKEKGNVEFEDYRYSDFYDMKDAPQIPLAGDKNEL